MLLIISPAKTQKMDGRNLDLHTNPELLTESLYLVTKLSALDRTELTKLMKISDKLADLTFNRYQQFSVPFTRENAKQALLLYRGDQFSTLDVNKYTENDFVFIQDHLRILSGLYGILRPLDLIQPYRLEMATRLKNVKGSTLVNFWKEVITEHLRKTLAAQDSQTLVNLASEEYFKAIDQDNLNCRILKISFKEIVDKKPRIVAIHAKRARGMMVDFAIKNKLIDIEQLQDFSMGGYQFSPGLSSEKEWIFTRLQE